MVPTALLSSLRLRRRLHLFPHFCGNQDIIRSLDLRRMSPLVCQSSVRIHSANKRMEVRESQLSETTWIQQPLWTQKIATSQPNGCSNPRCSLLAAPLYAVVFPLSDDKSRLGAGNLDARSDSSSSSFLALPPHHMLAQMAWCCDGIWSDLAEKGNREID